METWTKEIELGMQLIMHGCQNNRTWAECDRCPFNKLCSSIYKDNSHSYSTPDNWEEEGMFSKEE